MSITPNDILKRKKDLNKHLKIKDINLNNISIDDLKFNGNNYDEYIALKSLLDSVNSCQISDAYNEISRRSGIISGLKSINNLKVWGKIFPCETAFDDWGTSALAIDEACEGDVLFIKTDSCDAAVWGELASTSAMKNGIKATAVYGSVRDMDALYNLNYPLFSLDFVSNAGTALGLGILNQNIEIEDVEIHPGDFFFGDESGVITIPKELFTQVMNTTLAIKIKESNIIEALNAGKTLAQIIGLK
ncbi:RraA family protein [Methanobrevibacter oralis]|uniref:RraA family protein n=1 Tax=Methanobrevibacter oralis TaxID=66851 RepID=UPI001C7311B9|nr:RraA family protein [Methanobrevibacter oralis]